MNEQLFAPLYKRFAGKYTNHASRFVADGGVVVEARGQATTQVRRVLRQHLLLRLREFRHGKLIQVTEYMDTDLAVRVLGAPGAIIGLTAYAILPLARAVRRVHNDASPRTDRRPPWARSRKHKSPACCR